MFKAYFSVLALLGLMFSLLRADDGVVYMYPDGSGLKLVNDARVTMLAETVDVRVLQGTKVKVKAVFWVKNLTDDEVSIKVAFPFKGYWGISDDYYDEAEQEGVYSSLPFAGDSMHFVSLVDGKSVKTRLVRNQSSDDDYAFYFTWDLSLGPGQKRRLQSIYNTKWEQWGSNLGFFGSSFSYVLRSGATWAGPIGDALIRVEIPEELRPTLNDTVAQNLAVVPRPYQIKKDYSEIIWHFENWEPTQDLLVEVEAVDLCHGTDIVVWDAIEQMRDMDPKGNCTKQEVWCYADEFLGPPELRLQYFINTIFAFSGHKFSREKWQSLFGDFDWYKPQKKLTVKQLPRNYRKCVETALELREQLKETRTRVEKGPYGKFVPDMARLFWNLNTQDMPEQIFVSGDFVKYLPVSKEDQKIWLKLARNAFYARAGRRFKDQQLQDFFSIMPWYIHQDSFEGLTQQEHQAVSVILKYQKEHGL